MPATSPRYAVFGHPIAHSLSPRLHALFAARAGIELEYMAIDVEPGEFEQSVRAFFADGGCGANVTLPHKAAAFGLADVPTARARQLGIANVLTRLPDGGIEAESNDGAGMLADLRGRCGVDPRGRKALLLGAGGAARAAAFALLDAGAHSLVIANRTFARAEALVAAVAPMQPVHASRWDSLGTFAPFELVVNATSAGVQHAALALPSSIANETTVAYDLSYGPAAIPFLDWARAAGCAGAFGGMGMLMQTAAASFKRWHGMRPDTEAAMRVLRDELP